MPATTALTSSRALLPLFALVLAAPAPSQNFSRAPVEQVNLADFRFIPPTIRLSAGKPVILRLTNVAEQAHEFAAPQFFGAAAIRQGDAKLINKEGEAEVAPGTRVEIGLVPRAGTYHLQCNKPGHAAAGMQGSIIVM
jgi:uncharacterized cupredoxin-like copper-binding protein